MLLVWKLMLLLTSSAVLSEKAGSDEDHDTWWLHLAVRGGGGGALGWSWLTCWISRTCWVLDWRAWCVVDLAGRQWLVLIPGGPTHDWAVRVSSPPSSNTNTNKVIFSGQIWTTPRLFVALKRADYTLLWYCHSFALCVLVVPRLG